MKSKYILIISLNCILLLFGCTKGSFFGNCEEALTIENSSGLELHIKDTTLNKFIYNVIQPIRNFDSLEVWNNQGVRYKIFKSEASDTSINGWPYFVVGVFGLYDSKYDGNIYSDTIHKSIYLKYKQSEWDTINISFKAKEGVCGSEFAFLEVEHRKKIISVTKNDFNPKILIRK